MKIAADTAVSIDYTLKNDAGEVIDTSQGGEPLTYLHGHGNIVPGLERALEGHAEGDSVSVSVEPEDGYGERQENMTMRVPRSELPDGADAEVGAVLAARGPNGEQIPLWVTEVGESDILVDANHPLAGKTLHFDIKVSSVRAATDEEKAHSHVHGPDEHPH